MDSTGENKTFNRIVASCIGVTLLLLVVVAIPSSADKKHRIVRTTTTSTTIETTTTLPETATVPPTTDTVPPPATVPTFSNPNAQSWGVWLPQVRRLVTTLEDMELSQDFSGAASLYQSLYDLGNVAPQDSSGSQVQAAFDVNIISADARDFASTQGEGCFNIVGMQAGTHDDIESLNQDLVAAGQTQIPNYLPSDNNCP